MKELPMQWTKAQLGDIASQGQYGWTTKASDQGLVKYLRTTDITHGEIKWEAVPYCQELPPDLNNYLIQRGDILISRAGSVGYSSLIDEIPSIPTVFASYLIRYRPSIYIDSRYLSLFLRSNDYWQQISDASAGIALSNVNAKKLSAILLPLAPLNEQKRIADKLDTLLARVDACREHLDRVHGILKRFRQAVLSAAVSGKLTEEWREQNRIIERTKRVAINETESDTSYGSSAKSKKSGIIPVLRMGNIQDGKLDWEDLVYTSDQSEIKKYELHQGDVLFNRTNSPELVGKTAVYKGERPAIYAGYLIRIKCGPNLLPDYLNYCLNSPDGRDWCWRVKSDGVSQSNINAQKLGEFRFLLPSFKEQEEIIRRVEILFVFADRLESRYQTTRKLVDDLTPALLAKAFRGELVPQDPNDEPASVLLERIRVEKTKSTKSMKSSCRN